MIPSVPEIVREAVIVIAGAVLAAVVIAQFPQVKKFIADSWRA